MWILSHPRETGCIEHEIAAAGHTTTRLNNRMEHSMTTTEYTVTGMTCGHCERAIREEVGQITGVTGIEVDATTGHLAVTSDAPVDDAAVLAAVDEAGYAAERA